MVWEGEQGYIRNPSSRVPNWTKAQCCGVVGCLVSSDEEAQSASVPLPPPERGSAKEPLLV